MASKTVVEWVDDIDGAPATETVSFALDGVEYEIDLSAEHATQLRTALTEFIRKARPETSAPQRADAPVEDDEEPGLIPAPAPAESSRHLPAPRSAIKSRISATQLAMDVDGIEERPTKPARTTRKAAPQQPAKVAAAKTTAAKTTAKTAAAKQTAAPKPQPTPEPTPEPKTKTQPPAAAKSRPAAAKAQPTAAAKAQPAPAAKAEPAPAAKPEPAPEPEPQPDAAQPASEQQRLTMASPFSQPEQPRVTRNAGAKDGPPRPPMITFSSAKP
ncbi:MAG TPA: Lsr2 family protein [Pseudonocardiaceae bacterium]